MAQDWYVNYVNQDNGNLESIYFDTRQEAQDWIDHQDDLYWSQIICKKAASKKPKYIFKHLGEIKDQYESHEGTLETYFETGMECLGLILSKDEPKGPPNPNFDPVKPERGNNFRFFKSHESVVWIEVGDILVIDGVPYGMLRDRDFAQQDGHRLSFYPVGFSRQELMELFLLENKRATLWRMKKQNAKA